MKRSSGLHGEWISPPLTDEEFDEQIERQRGPDFEGFLIRRLSDDALVGVCNLSLIIRRDFQNAFMGYAAVEGFQGQGLMRVGGRWRDHEHWAIRSEIWAARRES
ncbi:MAG: hypothetical protein JHC95_22940 [Solirubrobacteraceae bacterium]|nr:hypothetical protein [Solirubrobacteraceae bacterium]